jgi:endonuclease YncB( thermonuclease family)
MKPFNLEAALRGEPVVTRDGRKVNQVTKFDVAPGHDSVVAVIDGRVLSFNGDGCYSAVESQSDLFMAERTIRIGDVEVPEPVRVGEELKIGEEYWIANAAARSSQCSYWDGDKDDLYFLRCGMVHRTYEAAEAHRAALIKISGGTP